MNWTERAELITPGGAQTRSKRATAFPAGFPRVLSRGSGARVWDVDGREYIDWICGLASVSLGHCHPYVDHVVREQLGRGVSFSLPTKLEIEAAEAIALELQAEQIRFVKTGSEATEGAVRIARVATGRDLVISAGYHSWHSMFDVMWPSHPGVPADYALAMQPVAFNDLDAVLKILDWRSVAAVIVEPTRDEIPKPGYLQGLREACTKSGAVLIFDEIVTGFRWALRGGSEYFGVEPDLRCYGKAMANGYPLACIVGRRELMQHASYVSGTFGGECVALAAALATLEVFQKYDVIGHLWKIGDRLVQGFNLLTGSLRIDLTMVGYGVHPRIVGPRRDDFIAAVAKQGVLFHPAGFNVSYAHRDDEVDATLFACRRALIDITNQG